VGAIDPERTSAAGKAGADLVSAAVRHAAHTVAGVNRAFVAGLEAAFLTAMRARELWMGIGAQQVPDTVAMEEMISTACAGKETQAVVAFREGGYVTSRCPVFASSKRVICAFLAGLHEGFVYKR
jgi:hypothetical protein